MRLRNLASHPTLLLLILLQWLSASHPLPIAGPDQAPSTDCGDPLHYLMPEGRCPLGLRSAYIMSDQCPARSVCLFESQFASCPGLLLAESCPPEAPIWLLEYAPLEFPCFRQRCVRLTCFDEFCRARRPGDWRPMLTGPAGELNSSSSSSSSGSGSGSGSGDGRGRGRGSSCSYLRCGCPATEAELLADGCRNAGELLVLTADVLTGCPVKLCADKLPDAIESLRTATTTTTTATATTTSTTTTTASAIKPSECPSITCPPNTSELTVPDPLSGGESRGGCPLRICLLPELITGRAAGNVTTASTTAAITATTADPGVTTATTATNVATAADISSLATSRVTETQPFQTNTTNTTTTATVSNANGSSILSDVRQFTAAMETDSRTAITAPTASAGALNSSSSTAAPELVTQNVTTATSLNVTGV